MRTGLPLKQEGMEAEKTASHQDGITCVLAICTEKSVLAVGCAGINGTAPSGNIS